MSYQVCEEDLATARGAALETLAMTRSVDITPERYDWLYCDNPDGQAVLWSIRKQATGEMAGFTVALPRRMLVDGRERICWNGADFSIRQQHRSLGLALKLRRAAKDGVDAGRVDFLYAHPNAKMQLIHERVGHSPVGTMVRWAKPLRISAHLQRRLGHNLVTRLGGPVADTLFKWATPPLWYRPSCQLTVETDPRFDGRFDRLFADVGPARAVVGIRDARYLHWRYKQNPLYRTHALVASEGGRLAGYALFMVDGESAHLKDLFCRTDGPWQDDLLWGVSEECRRRGLASLSAVVLNGHPLERSFGRFGFRRRPETSQMFGYAAQASPVKQTVLSGSSWLLSVGDRDV